MKAAPDKGERTARKSRARRWWRWPLRILVGLLLLALLLRVAIHVAIPYVAEAVCESIGIRLEFGEIRLSVLTLRVELRDVALYASNGSESEEPLLKLDRGDVQFDLGALLGDGVIRFPWAELDGVDLRFGLEPDRMITLWDRIGEYGNENALDAASQPVEQVVQEEGSSDVPGAGKRLDLTLPVEIGSIRVQHLRLLFEDRRPGFELEAKILCNLVGKDLGSRKERNHLVFTAASPSLIEALRLDVDGIAGPGILKANVALHVAELEPRAVERHMRQLGVWPAAKDVALELRLAVDLEPREDESTGSFGRIDVHEMQVFMDGEQTLGMGKLEAAVDTWSSRQLYVSELTWRGFRVRAGILENGQPSIAGWALLDTASGPKTKSRGETPHGTAESGPSGMGVLFDKINLGDLELSLRDESRRVTQDLKIQELSVQGLALGEVDPPPTTQIRASLALPGSLEAWEFAGVLEPLGSIHKFEVSSQMTGLTLGRLSPYFLEAGFAPELVQGELSFAARLRTESLADGRTRLDLNLDGMKLKDGKDLLVLDKVEAKNWIQGRPSGGQGMELLEVSGLGVELVRDEKDRFHLLGMMLLDPSDSESLSRATTGSSEITPSIPGGESPEPASADVESRFWLRQFLGHNSWVHLTDRSESARLRDIHGLWSADIKHLELGEAGEVVRPLEFDFRVSIREMLDRLQITGQMSRKDGGRALTMQLEGGGLRGQNLKPFLEAAGVSPEFDSASLSLRMEVSGLGKSGILPSNIVVGDVRFRDGKRSLFELSALEVLGLSSSESGTQVEEVRITKPVLRIKRDKAGAIHLAGVRMLEPKVVRREDPDEDEVETRGEGDVKIASRGRLSRTPEGNGDHHEETEAEGPVARPSFLLRSLDLRQLRLEFLDQLLESKSEIPVTLDLKVKDLSVDSEGASLNWDLSLSVPDNVDQLRIQGELEKRPELALGMSIEAAGIREGSLGSYLPENLSLGLSRGKLEGKVALRLLESDGSRAIQAELEGWRLRDGEEDLWRLDRFELDVSRSDHENEIYNIKSLVTQGHEIWLRRDEEKNLRALGLIIAPEHAPDEGIEESEDPSTENERIAAENKKRLRRLRTLRVPLEKIAAVHLGRLSLGLDKIHFVDKSVQDSKPVLGHLKLWTPKPIEVVPSDFDDLLPMELNLEASLEPIFRNLKLKILAQPWDVMPELSLSLRVDGLRGEGLTEVFPSLREKIHGRALSDGVLKMDSRLTLQMRRSSRTRFPLENGFGFSFEMDQFEFRDKPQGRVLAGLDSLEILVRRFEPQTGRLWIRSVSVDTPRGRIDRTEEGLILGGLCLLMPETHSAELEKDVSVEVETVNSSALEGQGSSPEPKSFQPAVRVDTLSVSGCDFVYQDLRASPPMVLPIVGLEAEVKNYSQGPGSPRRPILFQAYIDGGLVELPKRLESGGLIRGLVSTASNLVDSEDPPVTLEKRPVFEELGIKGSMHLRPTLSGQYKLDLASLELLTFKSLAKRVGVVIGDGVLDLSSTTEVARGRVHVSVFPVFTFLSLSEPKDGFLSNYLGLPAPLDATLFLTRNSDGEHVYPFSFSVEQGAVAPGQVRGIVVNALSRSLTTMVTNSPFRLIGGVTSLVGLDFNKRASAVGAPTKFRFEPGQSMLTPTQKKRIETLVRTLKTDPNITLRIEEFSGMEDWKYAERIGNPPVEECRALAKGMLHKRKELARERSRLRKRLVSLYQHGRVEDAERGGGDLRRLDQELGELEVSLEAIFSHLRPGSDRQKDRRTKVVNQELGRKRMDIVRKELLRVGGEDLGHRVEATRPRSRMDEGRQKGEVILVQRRRVGR